jgi:hypothetical protein
MFCIFFFAGNVLYFETVEPRNHETIPFQKKKRNHETIAFTLAHQWQVHRAQQRPSSLRVNVLTRVLNIGRSSDTNLS